MSDINYEFDVNESITKHIKNIEMSLDILKQALNNISDKEKLSVCLKLSGLNQDFTYILKSLK